MVEQKNKLKDLKEETGEDKMCNCENCKCEDCKCEDCKCECCK